MNHSTAYEESVTRVFMIDEKYQMFRNRLEKLLRHKGKQARRQGIENYRIYDHDIPEFPFCIEYFGENLHVAEYRRKHSLSEQEYEDWLEKSLQVMTETLSMPLEKIFLKLRRRKEGRTGQYRKQHEAGRELIVQEGGLQFLVNLSDYLDTGLFLDHRITRQKVRDECHGKKVLNLFAYTGSFSVYAAAGGASEVISVDLSNTYLKWAERNMALNGFMAKQHDETAPIYQFIQADVMKYLQDAPRNYFDIIILDPPTFSNSKKMKDFLDIQRDHVRLINSCLEVLRSPGVIYFSTNNRSFVLDAGKIKAREVKNITGATTPFDFEGKLFRQCFRITK